MTLEELDSFIQTTAVYLDREAQLRTLEDKRDELDHDSWGKPLHPAFMTSEWREVMQRLDDEIDRLHCEVHGPADPMSHVEFPFADNH